MTRKNMILLFTMIAALTIIAVVFFYSNQLITSPSTYGTLAKSTDLYLEIDEDSTTKTSLTYTIYNQTEQELYYGVDYEIEVYKSDGWRSFDVEASWIELAVVLAANSSNEETIDWTNIYGALPKGQYRLIKTVNNTTLFDAFEIRE